MSKGSGGWFWLGAGIGLIVSAGAVVISSEFFALRKRRMEDPGFQQGEDDLVEDLSLAVHEGLQVLSKAATEITSTFTEARREAIRFGLDPQSGVSGDSSAWYTGDDED